jgi:two-component system secretion response regulator SsrB
MLTGKPTSVLIADRNHSLLEGIRSLLQTTFDKLFAVTDEPSLTEGAQRLQPTVIVVDLSFAAGSLSNLLEVLRHEAPEAKVLMLSVDDQAAVFASATAAGADGIVLKRAIASDLVPAIDALLAGRRFFGSTEAEPRPTKEAGI